MTVFAFIPTLHVFGCILYVSDRIESNIHESRKGYEAAALCAMSSTPPHTRSVLTWAQSYMGQVILTFMATHTAPPGDAGQFKVDVHV